MKSVTPKKEPLPDFIVIGAEKAGTTSLHLYLSNHPEIFMPQVKEVRFFDLNQRFKKGPDWYRQFFIPGLKTGAKVFGEASPGYLHNKPAAVRISKMLPDAKLIVLLRDPVQRAYSHYWNQVRGGYEERSFADVVMDHMKGNEKSIIFHVGHYIDHLERFDRFFTPDQLYITFTSELEEERLNVCQNIFSYLKIDSNYKPSNLRKKANTAALPHSRLIHQLITHQSPFKKIMKRVIPVPYWLLFARKLRYLNYKKIKYADLDSKIEEMLRDYYHQFDERLANRIGALPWR